MYPSTLKPFQPRKLPYMTSKQNDRLITWACAIAFAALILILNSVNP